MKKRGTNGADEISGTFRADVIRGLDGDDILHGNGGFDSIYGGRGNDTIDVTLGAKLFSGDAGDDTFKVVGLSFGGGTVAVDGGSGIDTFDANSVAGGSDYLYFIDNGNDRSIAVSDYVISDVEVLHGGFGKNWFDFQNQTTGITVFGGEQDDVFIPSFNPEDVPEYTGNHVMYGLGGNDTFTMRYGAEAYGGDGDDTFFFHFNARTTVDGGNGIDTIVLSNFGTVNLKTGVLNLVGGSTSYATGIENVVGSTANDTLIGDAKANMLQGGYGDDTLTGGAGADKLVGGAGIDTIDGGSGSDTASYADQTDKVIVLLADIGDTTVRIGGSADDILRNIENIIGGTGNDSLTGNAKTNTLAGGDGNDVLDGGAGSDILFGGVGKDTLTGGSGADKFRFADTDMLSSRSNQYDEITDFSHADRDRIELNAIDANTLEAGDQRFRFIGTSAFGGHAGELHYVVADGSAFVSGDTNGDGIGDFTIKLDGVTELVGTDFRF